jgi:peptidoglycan/LPS O-acetylase OafA/YrhL
MPPLFAISGAAFVLAERREGRSSPFLTYLLRRWIRILVPYFAYALVCAAIVLFARRTEVGLDGRELAAVALTWINPLYGGSGHSMLMLSWHLWFVAPFLMVTTLMPFLAPSAVPIWCRPWTMMLFGLLLTLGVHQLTFPHSGVVQNAVFYLMWSLFGVVIASAPGRFKTSEYAVVLFLALFGIATAHLVFPNDATLDMQKNKFPPNAIFFLFSCAWMSLLLMVLSRSSDAAIAKAARMPLLQPFIRSGYSIYLWQGLGYSIAVFIGRKLGWSIYAIWPLAVATTILFGVLASPLERFQFVSRRPHLDTRC